VRARREVRAPARDVRECVGLAAGGTELVEQHEDRLAEPVQDLHLRVHVAGVVGRLGCVDHVQQHVAVLARVADRLLARPERPVREAVPQL
jgi:predicted lipid carrier protein YhbT